MLKTESYRRAILFSTGLNVIIKAVLFINSIAIAYYFGSNIDTDLYFYLFSTVTLIAGLINGMDLAVLIPEGMHISEEKGMQEARQFYNFFGFIYLLLGSLLFILLFFFSVPIFHLVSSYNRNTLSGHYSLLLLSSGLPLLIILSNYFTSVLTTLKYFTAPLIANGIAQLFALGSLVLFHHKFGISAVLAGMITGYMLNVLLLVIFMRFKLHWNFKFHRLKLSKRIKRNLLSVQLGNLTSFAYNYGIILLLSGLAAGIYSAYNYSMQIVNMPNTFIVSQVAAVAGIKFNELAAKKMQAQLNKIFIDSMSFLMFLLVPLCFLTWLYADTIVNILFVRGTFTKDAAVHVVMFIKYLIFLLPCMAINTFLSRLLISIKKVNESFYFQVGFNLFILINIYIFTNLFGLDGFVWTVLAINYLYFMIVCIFLMKWLMPYIDYVQFLKLLLEIILLNLPLFIIAVVFLRDSLLITPFIYIGLLLALNRIFKVAPYINLNILKT